MAAWSGIRLGNLPTQRMADDAGIFEEGLAAAIDMHVRAADSHPAHLHQNLAGLPDGFCNIGELQPAGGSADNGPHRGLLD